MFVLSCRLIVCLLEDQWLLSFFFRKSLCLFTDNPFLSALWSSCWKRPSSRVKPKRNIRHLELVKEFSLYKTHLAKQEHLSLICACMWPSIKWYNHFKPKVRCSLDHPGVNISRTISTESSLHISSMCLTSFCTVTALLNHFILNFIFVLASSWATGLAHQVSLVQTVVGVCCTFHRVAEQILPSESGLCFL